MSGQNEIKNVFEKIVNLIDLQLGHPPRDKTSVCSQYASHIDRKILRHEDKIQRLRDLKRIEAEFSASHSALTEAEIEKATIDFKIKDLQLKKKEADAKYDGLRKNTNDLNDEFLNLLKYDLSINLDKIHESPIEVDEAISCGICFEKYDNDAHQQVCLTICFHAFCASCINELNPKICPKYRKSFNTSRKYTDSCA